MKPLLIVSFLTAALASAFGQDKPLNPSNADFKAGATSVFNAKGITRNPFEPIGYVDSGPAPEVKTIPVCTPDMFKVSSIIVGNPGVAVINGKDFAEGDWLPVPGQEVKVKLIKVMDGQIILQHPSPEVGNKGRIVVRN